MTRVGEINAPPASSVKKITRGVESILAAVDSAFVYFRMDRTGGGVDSRGSRLRFRLFSNGSHGGWSRFSRQSTPLSFIFGVRRAGSAPRRYIYLAGVCLGVSRCVSVSLNSFLFIFYSILHIVGLIIDAL